MIQRLVLDNFPNPRTARALSPNGRVHWAVRKQAVDLVHQTVVIQARIQNLQPMHGHVTMRVRFVYGLHRARDDDNLGTGIVKAARDSLVRGGWLEADDVEHLRQLPVEVLVATGRRALELTFEETSRE